MKAITAFLLIALIYVCNSQATCADYAPYWSDRKGDRSDNAYSLDFCRSTSFDSEKYYTCCFIKWRDTNNSHHRYNCLPVNHTMMADIDPLVDYIKGRNAVDKLKSLDCASSYLYGSLLLILALLF